MELGFSDRLISGDVGWGDSDPAQMFSNLSEQNWREDENASRVSHWETMGETSDPKWAIAFLVDVLGSQLERESAAAAAALWRQTGGLLGPRSRRWPIFYRLWDRFRGPWKAEPLIPAWWDYPLTDLLIDADELDAIPWDPEEWTRIYRQWAIGADDPDRTILTLSFLSGLRISRALRSPDAVTRSLAAAALLPEISPNSADGPSSSTAPLDAPGPASVSTMIHGTWAWKGDWWRPGRDFHRFILQKHRKNLYSGGARFSWSGALSDGQRRLAAQDLCEWADDLAPGGLQTVFAHSYGGEVAARAVLQGARVDELVLLSVPVTSHVAAAVRCRVRVVDIRLRFDPVLALARRRQRIPAAPNVTPVLLKEWQYGHGASHDEDVWRQEEVARRGGI